MNLEDIYVGVESVKKEESIKLFINKYLNNYKEESQYYEYPPFFGETEYETEDYKEMMSFVLKENGRSFRFYYESKENPEAPKGMIFINEDGSVFLGLGVFSEFTSKYKTLLESDLQTSAVLICNEALPPETFEEFKSLV